jgi:hypothetical protein
MTRWVLGFLLIILQSMTILASKTYAYEVRNNLSWWKFQSIDTMKYSRDLAREKSKDNAFNLVIDSQVKAIAETGATHVAIATPYDDEFIPYLSNWVSAARKYKLNVWFRGNFSGWEGWFDYSKINRDEHKAKTKKFINDNKNLFKDGDVFSACPECENGGPGDPRATGDVEGFRNFMIEEYALTQKEFYKLNKAVKTNFNSMNGDVAKLIMDKKTTEQIGGVVTVDHYVDSPKKLANDVASLAARSGGKVVLGEMGVPIPDIHGEMTEEQQAQWLNEALDLLSAMPEVLGINYWTFTSSSTQLWGENNQPKKAVDVLKKYYIPATVEIQVTDETNRKITSAYATFGDHKYLANENGIVKIPYIHLESLVEIKADNYRTQETSMERLTKNPKIALTRESENIAYRFKKLWLEILSRFKAWVLAK